MALLEETESRVFKASIVATAEAKDWDGSSFTLYVIRTENETHDVNFVLRRYNQFFHLNDTLVRASLIDDGQLPAKKWFFNMDLESIRERRGLLQAYLQTVLSKPELFAHTAVQGFLARQLAPSERHLIHTPISAAAADASSSSSPSSPPSLDSLALQRLLTSPAVVVETLTGSSVVPIDDGSSQFGWANRSIWDPATASDLPRIFAEEITRLRSTISKIRLDGQLLSSKQREELDACIEQLRDLVQAMTGS